MSVSLEPIIKSNNILKYLSSCNRVIRIMDIKKLTLVAVVISSLFLTGCFDKEVTCEINLNSRLIDLDRNEVIKILGEPSHSDLRIKLFDEYSYNFADKHYSVIVKYDSKNHNYYVTHMKCIKSKPRFEILNHVIWH